MATTFRQQEIIEVARNEGRVTVEGLAQRFDVTPQTIRRDLGQLCSDGVLSRVHGGAVLVSGRANIGYETRRGMAEEAKRSIGRICAAAIPNDCSLFINIGTTTEAVARQLLDHRGLMAITNNLNVANTLAENADCEVVVAGGLLRRSDGGLVGEATEDFFERFKVDYAIIGASALDEDGALLDFDMREVRVAQSIIANARQTWLVADATKFTRTAPVRITGLDALDGFFTDAAPPESIRALCETHGVALHVAAAG
ncbi:MAG: DeoR/GlpR family DNA-binding transcription regulator [Pseudomonadota bacterium]